MNGEHDQAGAPSERVPAAAVATPITSRLAAAAFLIALAVAVAVQLLSVRHTEEANAARLAEEMTKAVAGQIGGRLRAVDSLLAELAAQVEAGTWTDPVQRVRLQGRLESFPDVLWVAQVTAQGLLQPYGDGIPSELLAAWPVAEADFVTVHRGGSGPTGSNGHRLTPTLDRQAPAYVALPLIEPLTGQRAIILSRPVPEGPGRLRGVVVAAIAADRYAQVLEEVLLDQEGGSAVIRRSGQILARAPLQDEKFGLNIADSDLFRLAVPRAPAGVAILTSKTDGNHKFVGYQSLAPYDLVVTSGLSTAQGLASWRRMALLEGVGFLLLAVVAGYWSTLADVRAGHLLRTQAQLEQLVRQRTADLEQAKSLAEERATRLEAANAKLNRLAQVAAHHLQEPVRNIVSFTQLLRGQLKQLTASASEELRFVEEGGRRLKLTLEAFREYAELLGDEPVWQPVDLEQCTRQVLDMFTADLEAAGASVTVGALPRVRGDADLLRKAIGKLVGNAIRYRHGARSLTIAIEGEVAPEAPHGWRLSVRDNGIGVRGAVGVEEVVAVNTRGEAHTLSGTGLAFCQAVAEIHGGRLLVMPQPEGTCFTLAISAPPAPHAPPAGVNPSCPG